MPTTKSLEITIEHPSGDNAPSVGWIYLTFRVGEACITLHVSDVNDPVFDPAFGFLSLMNGASSQVIEIDEEIECKIIRISAIDEHNVRLQISDYDYAADDDDVTFPGEEEDPTYPRTYIDVELDRDGLIKEFFSKFIQFLEQDFRTEQWREGDINYFFMPALKNRVLKYCNDT